MTQRIVVLYEDQASRGLVRDFGPHQVVCAELADRLGKRRWEVLELVEGLPKKGNARVWEEMRNFNLDRVRRLFGVIDRDRVRDMLPGSPAPVCISGITECLLERCDEQRVEVVLLDRNLETVLKVTAEVLGEDEERLVRRKDLGQRDIVLKRLAGNPEKRREVLRRVESFGRLVDRIEAVLSE